MNGVLALCTLSVPVVYHYYQKNFTEPAGTLKNKANRKGKLQVGVPIQILSSTEVVESVFRSLLDQKPYVVGVDAEWKPNQVKGEKVHPVAILQIATPEVVYLIQLLLLDSGVPKSLRKFLSDPEIIKTGVGIVMDARKLYRDYKIQLRGCVELYLLAKRLQKAENYGSGLKALTNHFVRLSLPKNKHIQLSDWSVHTLSRKQKFYAAADAWAGLLIFEQLLYIHISNLNSNSKSDTFISFSSWWNNNSVREIVLELTKEMLEKKPRSSQKPNQGSVNNTKPEKEWKGQDELSCRKTPLYDGCQMLTPDGQHISYCNKDKIQWYLDKGIADLVPGSDPAVIKLKFFPSGKTGTEAFASEGQVIDHDSANRCVICGNTESYQKFYVVPRCYRQYFPPTEKFHCSHDIVLLCPSCHYHASSKTEEFKQNVIIPRYGIPIKGTTEPYIFDSDAAIIAAAARQLKRNRKRMNEQQIQEREQQIMQFFGCDEITPQIIDKAASVAFKRKNPDYLSHGEAVVQSLLKKSESYELQRFVVMWRKFFEEEFSPKYLPKYWDPNHEWQEQHGNGERKNPYF